VFRIAAENLTKRYEHRWVLKDISLSLSTGESMAVTGPNGSGKSTLLKTLLHLERPTKGDVRWFEDDRELDQSESGRLVGFVAPYVQLYDQLSAEENLKFFASVGHGNVTGKRIDELMEMVGLEGRAHDLVGGYSSGMKQRLKYAVALQEHPKFLFLDEPTSNLDDSGRKIVRDIVEVVRAETVLIIATNEPEEYAIAQQQCQLGD